MQPHIVMVEKSVLREYRERQIPPLSLDDLAGELGVDKSTMSRWETGQVPAERVLAVESLTGISRHDLRPDVFGDAPAKASAA